jgi:G3E family GTPase
MAERPRNEELVPVPPEVRAFARRVLTAIALARELVGAVDAIKAADPHSERAPQPTERQLVLVETLVLYSRTELCEEDTIAAVGRVARTLNPSDDDVHAALRFLCFVEAKEDEATWEREQQQQRRCRGVRRLRR